MNSVFKCIQIMKWDTYKCVNAYFSQSYKALTNERSAGHWDANKSELAKRDT